MRSAFAADRIIGRHNLPNSDTAMLRRFWIIRQIFPFLRLVWRLMWDRRVPAPLKLLPVTAALYVVMPADLVLDFIPLLGQLDDLVVAGLLLLAFVMLAPREAIIGKARRRRSVQDDGGQDGQVIEGRFRYVEDE